MSMTGLVASGDCTVGGEKNGLAVRLMMELVCLDVDTETLSGPEALWQPLRSCPWGAGSVWPPFSSISPSSCPIMTGSVLSPPEEISSLTLSSWILSLASSSSSCSSLTGRKCLSWITLSSMSSSLWEYLPGSSMISTTAGTLTSGGGEKSGLVELFFKLRFLSFSSLLLSAHVGLLDKELVFTFSTLSSSDPSPWLLSVKALTLCLRRLKSCTPLELELDGMVS